MSSNKFEVSPRCFDLFQNFQMTEQLLDFASLFTHMDIIADHTTERLLKTLKMTVVF